LSDARCIVYKEGTESNGKKEKDDMTNNVVGHVQGGERKVFDNVNTVADIKRALGFPNHLGHINGTPALDTDTLKERDYVLLTENTKGGNK